jgi:Kef-type K+ transport system membrane component KefB
VNGGGKQKRLGARITEAVALVLISGVLYLATRAVPEFDSGAWTIAAIGFLLLSGTLLAEIVALLGTPHLTGYLLAGILAGPSVLKLVDHHSVERMSSINDLALALIALEGGAELRGEFLKKGARSLSWATLLHTFGGLAILGGAFFALRPFIGFLHSMSTRAVLGVALLWGVMGITRSPSATLGILSQTRASGPLTRFSLSFVMMSDVVVVVVLALATTIARPLLEPGAAFSTRAFTNLGREVLGSVSLGTTLGIVLALYLRLIGRQLVLVFLALGFGASQILSYLSFDPLLTFMVAGFLVQNLSAQGEKLVGSIHEMGEIVYVVFFATAGAQLDLSLLKQLWGLALALAALRAVVTYGFGRAASAIAKDEPVVKRWGWAGLVSQAGLGFALSALVAKEYPSFGDSFNALAIAVIAINQLVGPILFKLALDRAGETSHAPAPSLPSMMAPPPPLPRS